MDDTSKTQKENESYGKWEQGASLALRQIHEHKESYTSGSRTSSVDLRFWSFSIMPAASSSMGFSFSAFFFESVETEMTQERDQK